MAPIAPNSGEATTFMNRAKNCCGILIWSEIPISTYKNVTFIFNLNLEWECVRGGDIHQPLVVEGKRRQARKRVSSRTCRFTLVSLFAKIVRSFLCSTQGNFGPTVLPNPRFETMMSTTAVFFPIFYLPSQMQRVNDAWGSCSNLQSCPIFDLHPVTLEDSEWILKAKYGGVCSTRQDPASGSTQHYNGAFVSQKCCSWSKL